MGCRVSHTMQPELDIWLSLLSMIGGDTSIAQALPLLDRADATEEDYDVIQMMRAWAAEAREEQRKKDEAARPK